MGDVGEMGDECGRWWALAALRAWKVAEGGGKLICSPMMRAALLILLLAHHHLVLLLPTVEETQR